MAEDESIDIGELPPFLRELANSTAGNCTPIPDEFFDHFTTAANARQLGVSIAYGVICAVRLIANAAVIFLLLTGGRKGTTFKAPSTILIMNLAIADTLLLLTLPFSMSHRLYRGWRFGNAMCKFEEGVKFLNYYGSVFFITAMAIDRFLVISRPGKFNRKMARKSMLIASCVLWCVALVAVVPLLIFAGVDENGFCSIIFPRGPTVVRNSSTFLGALQEVECIEDYFYSEEYYEAGESDLVQNDDDEVPVIGSGTIQDYEYYINNKIGAPFAESGGALCRHPDVFSLHTWLVWNFVIGFVVPFLIISLCYVRVMRTRLPRVSIASSRTMGDSSNNNVVRGSCGADRPLRYDASKLITQPTRTNHSNATNQRAKILLNILVPCLIASFVFCWLPYHLFHLLQIKGIIMSSDMACHVTRDVTFCLAFFNSALNPILNSFFLHNFKQRMQRSSTWISSQLQSLSTKKKPKRGKDLSTRLNDSRNITYDPVAMETTLVTSATGLDDAENV